MTGGSLGLGIRSGSYGSLVDKNGGLPIQASSRKPTKMFKEKDRFVHWILKFAGRKGVGMFLLCLISTAVFGLVLYVGKGEDSQTNPAHNIAINNTAGLGFIEFSPTYGEQRNGFDGVGVNSVVLPPPPPAVFLGYTLPPGHPCNSFSLPPPPADKKRTGPRPCPVCYLPVEEAVALMPKVPSPSPVKNLTYIYEENLSRETEFGGSEFGGYPTLAHRADSYDIRESMSVHCGFVRGAKPGRNTGFDIDEIDLLAMDQCHGVVVASAIFGNFDEINQPKNISEYSKETVCFYMFIDEITEDYVKKTGAMDSNRKIGVWRVIVVRNLPYEDGRRTGKIPKLLMHRLFPNARFSLWIDGKLELVVDPYQVLERFLWRKNATFAISRHYKRFDVFLEAEANKVAGKYDNASIDLNYVFTTFSQAIQFTKTYTDDKIPAISKATKYNYFIISFPIHTHIKRPILSCKFCAFQTHPSKRKRPLNFVCLSFFFIFIFLFPFFLQLQFCRGVWKERKEEEFGMALNLLSPAEVKAISFLDTTKSTHLPKLPAGITLQRKDCRAVSRRRVHCSVQTPPPAWPGRAVPESSRNSWDGPKPISVLGSTGSIGTQTLDIVAENPDKFRVVGLAAGSNVTLLVDQVKRFKPQIVAVRNEASIGELKEALADVEEKPEIIPGEQGVIEVARHPDAVTVVTGIVGCAGLKPTVAAIEAGKDIALANKETLIAGGPFILPLAHKHNIKILPADSEHSAIFQCIQGLSDGALRRIILTASGGAFRDWPVEKLNEVKVADALKHPNWNMGKKITVDSATLFNKGLEVIEAHYLFGADYDNIEIVIHPQSIIHSMVETQDSSILAQLGWPDMRLPILYTMSWPDRIYCSEITWPRLDLCKLGSLTFKTPDNEKYPSMNLAYAAGRAGGTMTGVLSAANEKAVEMFIDEKISYLDIFKVVELTCNKHRSEMVTSPSLEEIIHYDLWARDYAATLQSSSRPSPVPA